MFFHLSWEKSLSLLSLHFFVPHGIRATKNLTHLDILEGSQTVVTMLLQFLFYLEAQLLIGN